MMAEFARIRNDNAAMIAEIGALRTQAQSQTAEIQNLQAAAAAPPQVAAVQPAPTPAAAAPIIDTRYIGKPDSFDGVKGWRDWSTVFTAYCSAINPGLQALMSHAEQSVTPVLNATISTEQGACSTQLYFMLVMTCKDVALTRVVNAGQAEGLESWRSPYQHFEPHSSTRHAGLLLELLSVDLSGDVLAKIELFNRDVGRYELSSGERLADSVKVGTILKNMPDGALKQHLILNIHKFSNYSTLANEISEVRRAQAAAQSGPMPMYVNALVEKTVLQALGIKGGKGKG